MDLGESMIKGKQNMNYRLITVISLCFSLSTLLSSHTVQAAEQYKLQTRDAMAQIVDGNHDKAITSLKKYLKKHPNDLESMYGLTVAYSQKKDINQAAGYTRKAVDAGLDFGRFLAGPRDLLQPLTDSNKFRQMSKTNSVELLHGPMLGCVTDTSAKFWVRTANEVPVQIIISEQGNRNSVIKSPTVRTDKDKDYTAVITVEGLKPDTRYWYSVIVNKVSWSTRWVFRTFPSQGRNAKFQVGFGGGAGYTPQHERMWNTIVAHNPIAFLFLGDNVYIDNPTRPAVQQYCYYRRQSRREFRNFATTTAIYAIWDDHDFTTNDGRGGPEIYKPAWKIPVWQVFRDNWINPYYGGGEKQPGCWFDFSISDVDFFMLDCRFYRTSPRARKASMLGPVQKKWLLEKLKASTATFKVLASSVPWAFGTKPGSLDTWEGYKKEREDIFSFLEENRIEGVILLSADRHRSDIWKIKRPKGYDLYEFESSKLTNVHTHRVMSGALFGYNKKCSFGLLTFDTSAPEPTITHKIISIDNELIHTFSLSRSRLTHKDQ